MVPVCVIICVLDINHFKTHQSLDVNVFLILQAIATVSSVSMAKYFSDQWDDITIAFPINILEMDGWMS